MKTLLRVCACALTLTGCVSVDGTRAQLASKNENEIRKGEETIYTIATTGRDQTGFIQFGTSQQIEYIKLTSNNDLLLRIIDNSHDREVIAAATERLDFSLKDAAKSFVKQRFGKLDLLDESSRATLKNKIVSLLTEEELLELIAHSGTPRDFMEDKRAGRMPTGLGSNDKVMLYDRLITITKSPELLWKMIDGEECNELSTKAINRLVSLIDNVTSEELIEKILAAVDRYGRKVIDNEKDRITLMQRLPENKMLEFVLNDIKKYEYSEWNSNRFKALESGLILAAQTKNAQARMQILSLILDKIMEHRKECERGWGWDKKDDEKAQKLLSHLPALSSEEIGKLLCQNDFTWKFLMDKVSADCAYDIITQGKASGDLEIELIKKLPSKKIDMKVFTAVKSDAGKKAVMSAMPADVKKAAQEFAKKAAVAIIKKSKEFAKETFELQGFYLGMSFEDMKTVFAYHFPDWEIKESIDGDGDEADHVIYIPGQRSPFCYASVKDKKVYQFNFGKKVLKKWYKYDVQNEREWARSYARQYRIDMKYVHLNKETTVNVPQADLSVQQYKAWLHQDTWQWKNNSKEYRITYFGEPKVETAWGDVIEQQANYQFRYVRGDTASLRVRIERD